MPPPRLCIIRVYSNRDSFCVSAMWFLRIIGTSIENIWTNSLNMGSMYRLDLRTHFVTTLLCVEVQMYFKICNEVKIRMTYFVLRVSGQLEKGEVHNILDKPVIIS